MNAAVVQRPLLGLFGFPRNYLVLGLPLLESPSPHEALAVVAHEYGHLSGAHARFGAFIYRLRHTWSAIHAIPAQWIGFGGRALLRAIEWYAPFFNAYTFVVARANEYEADAASADLVTPSVAASALKRVAELPPRPHGSECVRRPLRDEHQQAWRARVENGWRARHHEIRVQRERLAELRALATATVDETVERLQLQVECEPDADHLADVAAFNVAVPDRAPMRYLAGTLRLDRDDESGLEAVDRAVALDGDAIQPACRRAYAFLRARDQHERAEAYARRWLERDDWESRRASELATRTPRTHSASRISMRRASRP